MYDVEIKNETIEIEIANTDVEINAEGFAVIERKEVEIPFECGETIGGNKAVVVRNGKIWKADYRNEEIQVLPIGVTKMAGEQGSVVPVVFRGVVNGFGNLTEGRYFVGEGGDLINFQPESGVVIEIGRALASDKMLVDVKLIVRR